MFCDSDTKADIFFLLQYTMATFPGNCCQCGLYGCQHGPDTCRIFDGLSNYVKNTE